MYHWARERWCNRRVVFAAHARSRRETASLRHRTPACAMAPWHPLGNQPVNAEAPTHLRRELVGRLGQFMTHSYRVEPTAKVQSKEIQKLARLLHFELERSL